MNKMRKAVAGLVLVAALIVNQASAGNEYESVNFYRDVAFTTWSAPDPITTAVGSGGSFSNSTVYYKVSGIADGMSIPLSTNVTVAVVTNGRMITVSWPRQEGLDSTVICRSTNAWTNFVWRELGGRTYRYKDTTPSNSGWTTNGVDSLTNAYPVMTSGALVSTGTTITNTCVALGDGSKTNTYIFGQVGGVYVLKSITTSP